MLSRSTGSRTRTRSLEQLRAHAEGQSEWEIYVSRHALPGILGMLRSLATEAPVVMAVSDDRLEALEPDARRAFHAATREAIEGRARRSTCATYHDAVLASGAMPSSVLEGHVEWSFRPSR